MPVYTLKINKQSHRVNVDSKMPLLWVLRDFVELTGTKFGCGIGQCGACTVQMDGVSTKSCLIPIEAVGNKTITTIEGLSEGSKLHPVQQAWIDEDVAQCGYCQAGQIMAAVSLLQKNPSPDDAEIDREMNGNICRCGTYQRIRKGIHRAANLLKT